MPNVKWNGTSGREGNLAPSTISAINQLPAAEKRAIYNRLVPAPLIEMFNLPADFYDADGHDLMNLNCPASSPIAETRLYHIWGARDPILYGQITDTLNGQIHVMLYVINDPTSPRFDVDRTPEGETTEFGVLRRNIEAEIAAMQFGLAPGQIRRGLRIMPVAIKTFEDFSAFLGHDRYFAEPLFYHNAVILERAGFAYVQGRRKMQAIDAGFAPGGELRKKLDGSSPFRQPEAAGSIRLRSWAIHDGVIDEQFTNITMYKIVGKDAGISTTAADISW